MGAKKKLGEEGQALIEFMLFLPFILMMYSVTLSIGNAINASINQQKIARSYLYYLVQNDSTVPRAERREPLHGNWRTFGMYIIGWKESFNNKEPVAPCFRFRVPLEDAKDEKCEDAYSGTSTQFIRVGTVYGVCGATYSNENDGVVRLPGQSANLELPFNSEGCLIR